MRKLPKGTSLQNLVERCIQRGDSAHASNGRWVAEMVFTNTFPTVAITHHSTLMLAIRVREDGSFIPVALDRGWGSVSDKAGINKILQGIGSYLRYNDLYSNEIELVRNKPEPAYVPLETPFVPPLSASDSVGM